MFENLLNETVMRNLTETPLQSEYLTKEQKIEYRKQLNRVIGIGKKDSRKNHCLYCGKECSSFCNSHSVPAFLLRNISENGYLYTSNKILKIPIYDDEKGVNNTGTFHLLCRQCDSEIFADYEEPTNYEGDLSSKMIAQIAMKNYLKYISKRLIESSIYDHMIKELKGPKHIYKQRKIVNALDLKEYVEGYKKAKRVAKKGWKGDYYVFCDITLDYVVPVTFQSNVTLTIDFNGELINNIYNMSEKYKTQVLHICVFPLENRTRVFMFIDSKHKRYRRFCKQFNNLDLEDKLKAINYIIFAYSEEVFINKCISEDVLNDENMRRTVGKTLDIMSTNPITDTETIVRDEYNFARMSDIPNLLSRDYRLN